jgi:site-specific recombinase XerD
MLRVDLAAAGIAYRDEEGRQRDFHALRHSYITAVVSSGASIKVAQGLARHSTSALTLDRYAASIPSEMTAAVNALPSVLNGSKAAKPSKR